MRRRIGRARLRTGASGSSQEPKKRRPQRSRPSRTTLCKREGSQQRERVGRLNARRSRPAARRGTLDGIDRGRFRAARALVSGALVATALAAAPAPTGPAQAERGDGFFASAFDDAPAGEADIDWDYWASVNPDVIGWIEIPGTSIDGPIARGRAEDPSYYLTHDARGEESPQGCFYLDADCSEGLASPNCVILGHNMSDGSMFAPLRGYLDASFASEHPVVVIRTPEGSRTFETAAARIVGGNAREKRTGFATVELLRAWLAEQIAGSPVVLRPEATARAEQALTLVTCMPGGSSRALVLATRPVPAAPA